MRLTRKWLLLPTLMAVTVPALAEHCWMVGCVGDVGYVFIPASQLRSAPADQADSIRVFGGPQPKTYRLNTARRLLAAPGLPSVGDVVTLGARAYLLAHDQLASDSVRKEIAKSPFAFSDQTMEATVYEYSFPDSGSDMRAGARLRILGFLGDAAGGRSSLFAIVRVEAD